ncbi:phytoene synthase [Mesobaculum littorinae]|uniref:Phytoene synthase n=1 Tax=Mesobaculum littorinae TaxID=2486419 RepID=A0A438AMN5_9RHOB|nr:squalene/phytoene synthase family protein [Mesobaculum littorinae]RVV99870.1 phytoene synthase [Mesobaculum littorinae]
MAEDLGFEAAAEIVRKGDPDRFLAVMAAPPAARPVLFPIFAMNLEVARAPWVTEEPLIAEMRLQWWRDALDEIASGGVVRRHEVTVPLATVLDAEGAQLLDQLIEARRADLEEMPFADTGALWAYLDATGGGLLWAAARALGADAAAEAMVRARGQAMGLANYLMAVPDLRARAKRPLPEGTDIAALAREGLQRAGTGAARGAARTATLAAWRASPLLRQAAKDPAAVEEGRLAQSEFARRAGLQRYAWVGR